MIFDFGVVTNWFDQLLNGFMPSWLATTLECVIVGVLLLLLYSIFAIIYIFYERKLCGWIQCRLGPMRVGPWGLLQLFADVIKILLKEIVSLKNIDRFLFALAPYLVVVASMMVFACLPWCKGFQVVDFNIGVFFMIAASSIGVIGILLAGWASNNKYALLGAMRSGAQMISYELSVGISIMTMVMMCGTMNVTEIAEYQVEHGWNIFTGHVPAWIAFIIYLIAANAENNRGPFDMPEAEHELTAGYHTEYSGIHYGFFYLAEYLNMFIVSGIASLMFFGGWAPLHIYGWDGFNMVMDYIPGVIWFVGKALFVSFLLMWVRWTYPRVRIDQMLALEWKYLMPFGLANLVLMALCVAFGFHF